MTNELAIYGQDGKARKFALVADNLLPSGKRAIVRSYRDTNARDPGRIRTVQWEVSGPIGHSKHSLAGILATDYVQNLETRWLRRLISAGARNAITLTSKDPAGVSGTSKLGQFKLGAQKLGANVSTSDNVTAFDEQDGRMYAHRGRLSTQMLISSWAVEATHVHPEPVTGALGWYGKGRVGLGAAARMRTRVSASTTGAIYEETQTLIGEDVYAGALADGSDRCWYTTRGPSGELENQVAFTPNGFETISNAFAVGDARVKATGLGPHGPLTHVGNYTGVFSFTDQAKPVPLSRALKGHSSANNGSQFADVGWGWNYYISDVGLRAISGHIDNPVGIGERMREFTGHAGRPTAIWAERGELWVAYLDGSNSYGYRGVFGAETAQTGQPDFYPWWYRASTTCQAIFSTNTPANTAVIWGEGTNCAYETIDRLGRDDTFTSRVYGVLGGSWHGTELDSDPHLLKVLRRARLRTKGMTAGSSWTLAFSFDGGSYLDIGEVTENGYHTLMPVQPNTNVPLDDIAGRAMKPRLTQVAAGSGAETTPPEVAGVLEVEYDEVPEAVTVVVLTVQVKGTDLSKQGTVAALERYTGSSTDGPLKVRIPDEERDCWAMIADIGNRRDIKGDGVEAIDVTLHVWATE